MATYPASVKSFTTKNAGDTIQPSHINELQDEITAIEDGLLNGSAPVNSSRITAPSAQIANATISSLTVTAFTFPANSTLTNLSVTGASTLGTVQAGASTLASAQIAGDSTIAGALYVATPPPCARVFNNAAVAIGNNSETGISFNSQQYCVPASMHSTASNSSRVIAPSSGVYLVTGHIEWSAGSGSTTGMKAVYLYANDTSCLAVQQQFFDKSNANVVGQSVTSVWTLQANEYVVLRVKQETGSTGSLTATAHYSPSLTLTKIR